MALNLAGFKFNEQRNVVSSMEKTAHVAMAEAVLELSTIEYNQVRTFSSYCNLDILKGKMALMCGPSETLVLLLRDPLIRDMSLSSRHLKLPQAVPLSSCSCIYLQHTSALERIRMS